MQLFYGNLLKMLRALWPSCLLLHGGTSVFHASETYFSFACMLRICHKSAYLQHDLGVTALFFCI